MGGYSIGDLARQAGVKVPTIRYHEQIGLVGRGPVPRATSAATTRPRSRGRASSPMPGPWVPSWSRSRSCCG
ncbi:MerR family transcriptional regulator [Devosia sp.]|uniref:MerR family transcriptional regulator n=1 Tax=Devosia sp. TaxID=1871048 RepID=UPI0037519DC5